MFVVCAIRSGGKSSTWSKIIDNFPGISKTGTISVLAPTVTLIYIKATKSFLYGKPQD